MVCSYAWAQTGFPTFPTRGVPRLGRRAKKIWWIEVGGKIRRVEVALGRDATGTRVPALPQRLENELAAAMTKLGEFGLTRGDARPGCRPCAAKVASEHCY